MLNNLILGETCLLKYQLSRLGVKKEATNIFDDMLINLDGVRGIVENDFKDLLSLDLIKNVHYPYYPKHGIFHTKPLNLKYTINDNNLYSWDVCSFFHFDVHTKEELASLHRKLVRTKNLFESEEPLELYYYHRYHENRDITKLKNKISLFISYLNNKYKKPFNFILITQNQGNENTVSILEKTKDFTHINFITTCSWVDIDDNWDAHLSNELFDILFKNLIKS